MQPQTLAQDEQPSENPFQFGYRLVQRTLPDGSTEFDQVPLDAGRRAAPRTG